MTRARLAPGALVFAQGDEADAFYVIEEGRADSPSKAIADGLVSDHLTGLRFVGAGAP
jgi:hypothetical protein